MKKLLLVFASIVLVALTFAQDDTAPWDDTHEIINTEVALRLGLDDKEKLLDYAVANFPAMLKNGVLNADKARLYRIDDHADFGDYLYGYYDSDYTEARPGGEQAKLEEEADEKLNAAWESITASIAIAAAERGNTNFDMDSVVDEIRASLRVMRSRSVVRNCSPALRLTLGGKIRTAQVALARL